MGLCRVAIPGVFFMLQNNKNTDWTQRHQRATEITEFSDGVEGYRAAEWILDIFRARGWRPGAGGVLDPLDISLMFG